MTAELIKLENCKRELSVEIPYEELIPYFEKELVKFKQKANIPGFRKGKAPLSMIKKMYGESIEYSSLENIANDYFKKYLKDNNIDIYDVDHLSNLDYKPKEKFIFKVTFDVKPEISSLTYKNLELTSENYIISEKVVEDEINFYKLQYANYELDGQAVDENYRLTVDIQELDDAGNILIGKNEKDIKVYLNNKTILKEYKEGLSNIRENEDRIIENRDEDGKIKKVKVFCKKIEKIIFPEMNEEFFKKVFQNIHISSDENFKDEIRKRIETYYRNKSKEKLNEDIINEIIKLNDIELPDKFVDSVLLNMFDNFKSRLNKNYKLTKEDEENFKRERRVNAIINAKWFLIKEKIIETENMTVNDDDLKIFAENNIEKYNMPIPAEKLIDLYKNNDEIKHSVLEEKVFELVKQNSIINSVEKNLEEENNNS